MSSPFQFVDFPAIDFQPDTVGNFQEAIEFVSNTAEVLRYFESARHVQEQLIPRLDPATRNKFKFVDFPEGIDPRPIQINPFSTDKIELIKRYKAPKSS